MNNIDDRLIGEIFDYSGLIDYQEGSIVSRVIINKKAGTVTVFAIDRDQSLSTHSAPYDALLQVIEGEGKIVIEDKEYILRAPGAIIMPANKPHSVSADTRFKMVLTMIKEQ